VLNESIAKVRCFLSSCWSPDDDPNKDGEEKGLSNAALGETKMGRRLGLLIDNFLVGEERIKHCTQISDVVFQVSITSFSCLTIFMTDANTNDRL